MLQAMVIDSEYSDVKHRKPFQSFMITMKLSAVALSITSCHLNYRWSQKLQIQLPFYLNYRQGWMENLNFKNFS